MFRITEKVIHKRFIMRSDILNRGIIMNPAEYRKMEKNTGKNNAPRSFIIFGMAILMINLITLLITLIGIEITAFCLVIQLGLISMFLLLIGLIGGLIYRHSLKKISNKEIRPLPIIYLLIVFTGIISNLFLLILIMMSNTR